MGITIHFEGQLKSETDYNQVIIKGIEFAKQVNSEVISIYSNNKQLKRVKNEADYDYEGPVRGIQIQPHENSDPLNLEFDQYLYFQDYCKTQFANISSHIKIIEFLRSVEQHFESLEIIDEGEYWDTGDIELLEQHFEGCFIAIENAKIENPNLDGPFRIGDRIIDLMD